MIRAFLDTNVLISAAIFSGGKPDEILRRANTDFEWLSSEFIVAEVTRVLKRKHIQKSYGARLTPERQTAFLAEIRHGATLVHGHGSIAATSCDIMDDPVLAEAQTGGADYLRS